MRELHVELLSGRKIVDRNGKKVGRIEEIVAEYRGEELIVQEVHVGRRGFAERFSLGIFGARVRDKSPAKLRWEDIDFTDPEHPRLKVAIEEL
ncbi:MAG TPA: PRC-barrel domain-containing protein [Thermoanaerobaculia bacterium]|jgi:sporulation protein YlmC with PRC-barrel domain|nr:PRC-barrel domain-containing protein [Thermoanaerobaculia bacterium]